MKQVLDSSKLVLFGYEKSCMTDTCGLWLHAHDNQISISVWDNRSVSDPCPAGLLLVVLIHVIAIRYNLLSKAQPPSHASPASSFVHELTVPGSMHKYLFQPSLGSKSPMPLILSAQPFHTVTSGSASRVTTKLSLPSSVTTSGTSELSLAVGGV